MGCESIQLKTMKDLLARLMMTHALPNRPHQWTIFILGKVSALWSTFHFFSNDHYSIIQTPYEEAQGSSYEETQRSPVEVVPVSSSLSTSTTQLAVKDNVKETKESKLEATLSLDPDDASMRFIDSPISVHRFTWHTSTLWKQWLPTPDFAIITTATIHLKI